MLPGTAPRATYCRAYRRGATAEELPQKATAVCYRRHAYPSDNLPAVHAAATCRQDLPAAHTTVHTPGQPTAGAYYLALGPAPSGRVIRM